MPWPPTGDPRLDGVICWNRICAVAEDRFRRHHRAGNQQPQRTRRGTPEALGSAAPRLDLILVQRGADTADLPGGASGLLARDYKGKEPIDW